MKKDLHPKYYPEAKITCACGSEFTTGSTLPEIRVEVCSACHPFFTGQEKFVDTEGRVEKFERQRQRAATVTQTKAEKTRRLQEEKRRREKELRERPRTLKEMLAKINTSHEPATPH